MEGVRRPAFVTLDNMVLALLQILQIRVLQRVYYQELVCIEPGKARHCIVDQSGLFACKLALATLTHEVFIDVGRAWDGPF